MKNSPTHRPRRTEAVRQLMLWGLVGSAVVWGVLEFFALQRARYHGWRHRPQAPLPR
jgi:hypothetical protein